MNTEKLFETAARNKMRFPFKGMVSTEDLWDLSLTNLDNVYKVLISQKKETEEESLLNVKTDEDEELLMKIEIVKYIVDVKLKEKENRALAAERKSQKQKIMSILSAKEDQDLQNKSAEELKKMLADLD